MSKNTKNFIDGFKVWSRYINFNHYISKVKLFKNDYFTSAIMVISWDELPWGTTLVLTTPKLSVSTSQRIFTKTPLRFSQRILRRTCLSQTWASIDGGDCCSFHDDSSSSTTNCDFLTRTVGFLSCSSSKSTCPWRYVKYLIAFSSTEASSISANRKKERKNTKQQNI